MQGDGPRVERKVVTVLFCDLVGFTARSDRADPEDVQAILRPFHELAKAEIERHGGTLDKFIGDAAMGVFGSPVVHEDDPERAVRSALRILDRVHALNQERAGEPLDVRIGVNTGEAVVTLASGLQIGENVAGDVVNTAARLQSAAPVGGVLVGEPTYLATIDAVRYEQLDPVHAKGKAEPLPVWRALAIRPLPTISERPATTPFVGRQVERNLLEQTFLRTITHGTMQLVTIVGEPGVGKSRLVAELASVLDRAAPGARAQWRRGRCLPYGEGITFWALGEIVKDQAGIKESDPPEERDRKVAAVLDANVPDPPERAWLRTRLGSLVGGETGPPVEREESFTAWRRFLEALAAAGPLVAVFEDLHWADPALLAFLEHLAEHAAPVPLLVIGTARPELYDRYPSWGAGMRNATALSLPPLSEGDTEALVTNLLRAASLPPEARTLLLERSGGNPLYAEEFARTVHDRGLIDEAGRFRDDAGGPLDLPHTIEALIAARLDTLPVERKSRLQDASVIGMEFWSGAVAYLGSAEEAEVREHLQELAKKEMVRRALISSIENQAEYGFWHALIRDVTYGQIPRAGRATKHRKAAAWLESIAGERLADIAEILAHHATSAMDLARAAGETEGLEDLERDAARYLRLAGVRTLALDVRKAEEQLLKALELTAPDDPDRSRIVASLAEVAFHAGRLDEASGRYEEAIDGLRAQGAVLEANDAMVRRSVVLEYHGDTAAGRAILSEAIELLEALPPGPELARALATSTGSALIAGRYQDVISQAARAIELADAVGERGAAARAHGFRGYARAIQGDLEGVDEQREALASLLALGVGRATAIAYNNLGSCIAHTDGSQSALDLLREGVAFAERRGLREMVMALQDGMLTVLFEVGDWDELLRLGGEVVEEARRQGSAYDEAFADADRAVVLACRQGAKARDFCESLLQRARPVEDPPLVMWALVAAANARLASGDQPGAAVLIEEAFEITRADPVVRVAELPHLVRLAVGAGDLALAERLLEGTDAMLLERYRLSRLAAKAILAEAAGDLERALAAYEKAAGRWAVWGHALERAHALLGAGRCLLRLGRTEEARERLEAARAAFAALRAEPAMAEALSFLG